MNDDRISKWGYKNLIINQIRDEMNLDENRINNIAKKLNEATYDELERVYEAFERFGVRVIMEVIKG